MRKEDTVVMRWKVCVYLLEWARCKPVLQYSVLCSGEKSCEQCKGVCIGENSWFLQKDWLDTQGVSSMHGKRQSHNWVWLLVAGEAIPDVKLEWGSQCWGGLYLDSNKPIRITQHHVLPCLISVSLFTCLVHQIKEISSLFMVKAITLSLQPVCSPKCPFYPSAPLPLHIPSLSEISSRPTGT